MRIAHLVSVSLTATILSLVGCGSAPADVSDETSEGQPVDVSAEESEENLDTAKQSILQLKCTGNALAFERWGGVDCIGSVTTTFSAAGLQNAKRLAATYLRYILGGPTPSTADTTIPSTGETMNHTADVQKKLCWLRAGLADGQIQVVSKGILPLAETCQLPTSEFRLTGSVNAADPEVAAACGTGYTSVTGAGKLVTDIERSLRAKNGWNPNCANYPTFFRLDDAVSTAASIDPEPAVLNATLGTTSGNSASATLQATSASTTAYRFPTSFTTSGCTSSVLGGAPCTSGSTTLGQGTVVQGSVQKMSNSCRCVTL